MAECGIETSVGISTYLTPHVKGFQGLLKHRYSDFLDGTPINLTTFALPKEDKRPQNADSAANGQDGAELSSSSEANSERGFEEIAVATDKESAEKLRLYISTEPRPLEPFVFTEQNDKDKRAAIHGILKKYFPLLLSDTAEVGASKVVRVQVRDKSRNKMTGRKRGRDEGPHKGIQERESWPYGDLKYLSFVLLKENKDTLEATSILARTLKTGAKTFAYAGTKDKRAVTTQRMTAYRTLAKRLQALNGRMPGLWFGDFKYVAEPLKLGHLIGNKFTIALRAVDALDEDVHKAAMAVKEGGFVNYFGLQRFGNFGVPTHLIGLALLQAKWSEAVRLILDPREGEKGEGNVAREYYARTGDVKGTLSRLPRHMHVERTLLEALTKHGDQNPYGALSMLPRNMRLLYVHAYRSYVWNKMTSERLKRYGTDRVVAGDLVKCDGGDGSQSEIHVNDDDVLANGNEEDVESSTAVPQNQVLVKAVKEEETSLYTITDVLLPLPGYDVVYPSNDMAQQYREALAQDGIDIDNMRTKQKEFSLAGGYRNIVVKPFDLTWEIKRYGGPNAPITETDVDRLRREQQQQQLQQHQQPKQVNPYVVTTALDDESSTETLETEKELTITEEVQPVTTEGEPMTELFLETGASTSDRPTTQVTEKNSLSPTTTTETLLVELPFKAVVLSFSLPRSSYATMLIRELCKGPNLNIVHPSAAPIVTQGSNGSSSSS